MTDIELKKEIERLIAICGVGRFSKALVAASTLNKRGMIYKISYFPVFWDKIRDIYSSADDEIQKLCDDLSKTAENKTLK